MLNRCEAVRYAAAVWLAALGCGEVRGEDAVWRPVFFAVCCRFFAVCPRLFPRYIPLFCGMLSDFFFSVILWLACLLFPFFLLVVVFLFFFCLFFSICVVSIVVYCCTMDAFVLMIPVPAPLLPLPTRSCARTPHYLVADIRVLIVFFFWLCVRVCACYA